MSKQAQKPPQTPKAGKGGKVAPAVSIITPCFNQVDFIAATLDSALAQTFTDWELLVVDDASLDNSVRVIREYVKKDKRINLLVNEKNLGPAKTRNKAIKAAKGRYIAFLDGDDTWEPEKLKQQLKFMADKQAAFSCHWYVVMNEAGEKMAQVCDKAASKSYSQLAKSPTIAGGFTAMYDTQIAGKQRMPDILKRQDLGLWLKLIRETGQPVYCCPQVLGSYRLRQGSVSANKWVGMQYTWRLFREFENLRLFTAAWYFTCYALNGVSKRLLKRLRR